MAGKWKKQWDDAKKAFTKATKQKKPKSSIDDKASKKTGLSSLLGECDKDFAVFEKAAAKNDKPAMVEALMGFRRRAVDFKKIGSAYCKDIQADMVKAKTKDLMSELDVLRKQIDAIADTMAAHSKVMEARVKGLRIADATAKNIRVSLEGACKRAALFLAQVKAKKDVKVWNTGILTASRDVFQQVGNVEMLRKKGKNVPNVPATAPPASINLMKVWRTGKPTFVAGQEAEMEKERMAFLKSVQDVAKWLQTA
jgi:hypothetical protein